MRKENYKDDIKIFVMLGLLMVVDFIFIALYAVIFHSLLPV